MLLIYDIINPKGEIRMSSIREKKVKCPDCGKENAFPIYDSVNVTVEPSLREKVLTQEAFNYKCECGCNTHIFYPMLYHDMEHKFMIQFCSKEAQKDFIEGFDKSLNNEMFKIYRFRIVEKPFEITEKILLLESKYDDRLIEILKEMLIASSPDQKISYLIYANDKEKGNVFLCLDSNNTLIGMMPFREDLYNSVYEMFSKQALDSKGYVINQEWARDFLCEVKL